MAAFLLNKYEAGGSRFSAAEAVATSADEEVVCQGENEKTREETRSCVARPCRWTSEASVAGQFGVCARRRARCAARAWRASKKLNQLKLAGRGR